MAPKLEPLAQFRLGVELHRGLLAIGNDVHTAEYRHAAAHLALEAAQKLFAIVDRQVAVGDPPVLPPAAGQVASSPSSSAGKGAPAGNKPRHGDAVSVDVISTARLLNALRSAPPASEHLRLSAWIRAHDGNVASAARALGVNSMTLRRRCQALKIPYSHKPGRRPSKEL
jgi:hypothetical protein